MTPHRINDHRIKEFRRVSASDLRANPSNFRRHPATQLTALRGSLNELGKAAPLIAYYDESGFLTLIDGHARLEVDPRGEWDVAIVDLSPEEANLAMALIDPLAAMAETDATVLNTLLRETSTTDTALQSFLDTLTEKGGGDVEWEKEIEDYRDGDEALEVGHRCPKCGYEWSTP